MNLIDNFFLCDIKYDYVPEDQFFSKWLRFFTDGLSTNSPLGCVRNSVDEVIGDYNDARGRYANGACLLHNLRIVDKKLYADLEFLKTPMGLWLKDNLSSVRFTIHYICDPKPFLIKDRKNYTPKVRSILHDFVKTKKFTSWIQS